MAGHSKWANIKHKKGRADAKKGKVFSRIAKEIISAVKQGGPDPKNNPRLRLALQKAKSANVPSTVVDRNIKKAGEKDTADYFELTYELYGHGGVGLIVEVMTDNKNRIASEMRIATNKRGGSIATPGSVTFNFEQKGVIHVPLDSAPSEDDLFLLASDCGAEEFENTGDEYIIYTANDSLFLVKEHLEEKNDMRTEMGLEMLPNSKIDSDTENTKSNLTLIYSIYET